MNKKTNNDIDLTLNEWLDSIFEIPEDEDEDDAVSISYMFPSENIRNEFLDNITSYDIDTITSIIEKFLLSSCSLGTDQFSYMYLKAVTAGEVKGVNYQSLLKYTYYRRLSFYMALKEQGAPPPWEGNTWILDLLPDNPKEAIEALSAYLIAHFPILPDGRINGFTDAITLIRAAFISTPHTESEKLVSLFKLTDREFEHLTERLYNAMDYETQLTPPSKDGGRDVIAKKETPGKFETIFIECKKYSSSVKVNKIRELFGVVADSKINKGVLITTSDFTKGSKLFKENNPQLELINGKSVIKLLNEYLGPRWPIYIDRLILTSIEHNTLRKQ